MNAGIAYVLDYFRGIAEGFSQASMGQPGYTVGVFGSGYVLDSVYTADLADFKWLAAPAQWQGRPATRRTTLSRMVSRIPPPTCPRTPTSRR